MKENEHILQLYKINPNEFEGFAPSKNYLIDTKNKKIIDKRTKKELPYDLETKILVYEDRQKTWFFDIAEKLKDNNEAGFVILMIATTYLESNQQYREGAPSNGRSNEMIKKALARMFPSMQESEQEIFIKGVRCGLFHDGITKKGILIHASQNEIYRFENNDLIVNPHKLLDEVEKDLDNYINVLKNTGNATERTNFEKMWDSQKGII